MTLGISLLIYASHVSSEDTHTYSCIPSLIETGEGILVYNPCSYNVSITLLPRREYNVTIGNSTFAAVEFSLEPGAAALIRGNPKAIVADGYLVPVQR